MNRILITGGAGFIGYHLAKKLEKKGWYIDLVDDLSRGKIDEDLKSLTKKKKIQFHNLNISSSNFSNIKKKNYSYIFHFAAIVGVKNVIRKPFDVLVQNIDLLNKILNLAKNQKNLKRFIFTSSSEIYAGTLNNFGLKFPTPEKTILTLNNLDHQRSTYMLSKIYGEAMCHHSNIPFTIVRPHNIYGPRMGRSHVIPEMFIKILNSRKNFIKLNSANHRRTFCYIDDAINMMINLSKSKQSKNKTFNIGMDKNEIKIANLVKLISINLKKKIKIIPIYNITGSPYRRCPSIKEYRKIFKKVEFTDLSTGLKKTFNWYLLNRKSKTV